MQWWGEQYQGECPEHLRCHWITGMAKGKKTAQNLSPAFPSGHSWAGLQKRAGDKVYGLQNISFSDWTPGFGCFSLRALPSAQHSPMALAGC